ncbi:MAG: 50S ribosomal protein L11 methyltransferase [Balneolaceae bacterium]|nr:MAG: 50S ribosomal protein L11 methyltransferase [Balneolaceae bacterium]
MKHIKLIFDLPEQYHEFFISELMELDFEGFEQFDETLEAYIEAGRYNDFSRELIEKLVMQFPEAGFQETEAIEERNWNELWEQSIQPQKIGRFLVKPTWSGAAAEEGEIVLEIDPKMAFGTGYHATTRLMLRQLDKIGFSGKTVLDAGTGTGILAIAALKLGAESAVGFDIDPWSERNAAENFLLNGVEESAEVRFGGMETLSKDEKFEVTLANINRNALLELLPDLVFHTNDEGVILLSGLLQTDEPVVLERIAELGLLVSDKSTEEEWMLLQIRRK